MPANDRRAAARRRAWGRGPMILRFEPLEGRQLLASAIGPDLVATQFITVNAADWGDRIEATGTIANQGTAATTAPVVVDIYASSTPKLDDRGAVGEKLGSVVVPAGLAPGTTYDFDQVVVLPPTTVRGVSAAQTLYITLSVDPYNTGPEAVVSDKQGRGVGIDTSVVSIGSHAPAVLIGTSISVTPTSQSKPGGLSWGDTFSITEQIKNNGQGNAPPTRARIVLTPAGAAQGGNSDVTIGTIRVPAISAYQTTNVVQPVALPAVEPASLGAASQFTISVIQDADFLTQPVYPRIAEQGAGRDQGPIGIAPGPQANTPRGPQPDLAPASVVASQGTLNWGQQFQVGAVIQNVGQADSGPFRVRFVATGVTGDVSHGVFLGDVNVDGLKSGGNANVLTTVQLPSKLPYGTNIASPAYARIYAIADPEDALDQSMRSNNMASSAPVLLQVVGNNGTTTVPTYPANVYANASLAQNAAKQAGRNGKLGAARLASSKPAPKHHVSFLAGLSESFTRGIEHQLRAFPTNFNKLLHRIGVAGNSSGGNPTPTPTAVAAPPADNPAAAPSNPTVASNSLTRNPTGGGAGFGASGITN